ncbi:MAG: GbsR/MarR family transcriptional regulator [Polyangiaceae bacterium]
MLRVPKKKKSAKKAPAGLQAIGAGAVSATRRTLLEGVGAEVAASFPGTTRLGGQIVAALYLSDDARSMDDLSLELGRSKSNIFSNLRSLDSAGIVEKRRVPGQRHDVFALRGKYPDVIIGAYLARLRRVIADKKDLSKRGLEMLGDAKGDEAEFLRTKLHDLSRKYGRFGDLFELLVAPMDGPIDLEALIDKVPLDFIKMLASITRGRSSSS